MGRVDENQVLGLDMAAMAHPEPVHPAEAVEIRQVQHSSSEEADVLRMLADQRATQNRPAFQIHLRVGRQMPEAFRHIVDACFYVHQAAFRHAAQQFVPLISQALSPAPGSPYHQDVFSLLIRRFLYFTGK